MAEIKISNQTKDRVAACKSYIERKYKSLITNEKEKMEDWQQLQQILQNLNFTPIEKELIKKEIQHKEAMQLRKKRQKITVEDFESIAIIGRGAFGEVRVCRQKDTNEIVAIKKMKKKEMLFKNQLGHVRAERDILVQSKCQWIVELKSSFQDDENLYLVMEFLSGGDLMTLLIKKDIIPERDAKFYIAELVLAVEEIHNMNYIHRDLKPDNILIDSQGHLKLSDFGLCKHLGQHYDMAVPFNMNNNNVDQQKSRNEQRRQLAYSTVGTPDYIAPEVFSQNGYNQLVDWWSIGVILFEMVIGYPPFYSDTPQKTCQKILKWKNHFKFPNNPKVSPQCYDLITKLMTDVNDRLGDANKIKKHPFFNGIDFNNIRNQKPPYIPDKKKLTSNFDKFEEKEPWKHVIHNREESDQDKNGTNLNKKYFQGYTYKRNCDMEMSPVKRALEELENIRPSGIKADFNNKQRSQSPKPITAPPEFNKSQRSQSPTIKEQLKNTYMQYIGQYLSPLNKQKQQQKQYK
ncbi:unnamed protein product [Paramecium primaurelia]|uniref:non-specific serine/threonine protein kinase n=1 Tax=Paramecium primaurelia TaxID=5886 RepID=A0A8S1KUA0_PARPR|nr:unnamed protein product [Paramecium primaurelia]